MNWLKNYLVPSIIGYHLSGASVFEICGLTGLKEYEVRYIIYGYTKQLSYGEI